MSSIKGIKSFFGVPKKIPTREPTVIYFDIETTLAQFYGFRLGEQNVGYEQIKKEPVICVICYAINDGKVQSLTFDLSKYNVNTYDDTSDKEMISTFVKIANTADLLIAHNSSFDLGVLGSRIMKHKLPVIAPVLVDDTYFKTKIKKTMSHKLDYLLRYFEIGEKVSHSGISLWKDVGNKDKKALQKMKDYCVGDVEGLRKLYKYVKPYIKSNLSLAVFYTKPDMCPQCGTEGSLKLHDRNRLSNGGTTVKAQWKCNSCGSYVTDGENLNNKKVTGVSASKYKRN